MNTIVIKADNKLTKALVAFCKALGLSYEVKKEDTVITCNEEESPYDPEFVKMILERAESAKKGNTVVFDDELREKLFG